HELGHALLVRRLGYQVVAVEVHAFGGNCQWAGDPTRAEEALVAWGGVLAQAVVWIAAMAIVGIFGWPESPILEAIAYTFTRANLYLLLCNLVPIPPLDGYWAWPLIPMMIEARKEEQEYQRARAERQRQKDRDVREANARAAAKEEVAAMEDSDKEEPPPM